MMLCKQIIIILLWLPPSDKFPTGVHMVPNIHNISFIIMHCYIYCYDNNNHHTLYSLKGTHFLLGVTTSVNTCSTLYHENHNKNLYSLQGTHV